MEATNDRKGGSRYLRKNKMSDYMARNIKRYRKLKGLTQRQLAERCGLSLMSIRRYETIGENNREPRIETSQAISDALGVPLRCIDLRVPKGKEDKRAKRDAELKTFLSTYGSGPQIDMTVEEMSELAKALMKWKRLKLADEATDHRDNIIDELADVRIMVRQMEILFQCEGEVEQRIDYKICRQMDRLDGGSE